MLKQIREIITYWKQLNVRVRRAFYASQNQTCLRDQYWQYIGEPETNSVDFIGKTKLLIGDWVEKGLVKDVLSKLHFLGWHLIDTQIPVGDNNPNWDGYIDALIEDRTGKRNHKYVIEIKTKSGFGANKFLDEMMPSLDHVAQLSLYLRCMSKNLGINRGKFIYFLLSDSTWGTFVVIDVIYNKYRDYVRLVKAESSTGVVKKLNQRFYLKDFLNRWKVLDEAIAKKELPKGEYTYMYPITAESVRSISDEALLKIIHRQAVWGDWQVLYSRYKDLQIKTDNLPRERTIEDINLCIAEYKRRHPKSKIQYVEE